MIHLTLLKLEKGFINLEWDMSYSICLDLLTTVHYCNCMTWYQVISAWLVKAKLIIFNNSCLCSTSSQMVTHFNKWGIGNTLHKFLHTYSKDCIICWYKIYKELYEFFIIFIIIPHSVSFLASCRIHHPHSSQVSCTISMAHSSHKREWGRQKI